MFKDNIVNYYIGEDVLLNTEEKVKILQINMNDLARPLILTDGNFIDLSKNNNIYIRTNIKMSSIMNYLRMKKILR